MATIRVAGVQMRVSKKIDENLPRILEHIKQSNAEFVLFPEMSLTGYHGFFSQKDTETAWVQIAEACRLSYVTALIGTGVHTDEGTFIQTRIKTDEGKLLGTHEKLVPTSGDREFCRPGGDLRVFKHR
ncbi:MAG: Carbon-nitrogen hydrolase family protein, partial [Candidatus Hydrogenedentes bacterium]|nr:Carbon-nitrogen hydrolase family protein [Candidatus Hydrogenedentota bacterium]